MSAGSYWFRMVKGEDFIRSMTFYDFDGVTPVNLSGYTAEFRIEVLGQSVVSVTQDNGIALGGAAGTITVNIPHATFDSATDFSTAYYALFLDPSNDKFCLLEGQFTREQGQ